MTACLLDACMLDAPATLRTPMLSFTVDGPPRGQARPRFASRDRNGRPLPFVRTYSTKEDSAYASLVVSAARSALVASPFLGRFPLTGAVSLAVRVTQKMPGKSEWKRQRKLGYPSVTKPDLSNVIKLIEDALIGVAFVDDKQVAIVYAVKVIGDQGEEPHVTVSVAEV